MSDKLVVDVDSSDAVLATKQMEALTGAVISMGEAFKSAKGSTSALKELRSLLVGLKGKGSAFDELSAAIKDLNRNSDLLRSSFETSIGQLNRTLKAEMAELKAQLRTDALEAGRQMGNGLEEGLKEADAKVKRQGRTLAATAKAEATRVYEAMVAGQANAKVKDPAVLGQLQEAGATLSPYHKQVLANWKESQRQMLKALKKQLDDEEAATQQLLASQASASGQLSAGAGGTAAAAAGRARAEGYTNAFGVYISKGTQEAEAAAMKALSAGSAGVASAAAAGKARAEGYTNAFGIYISKSISDKIRDAEAAGVRALSAGANGVAAAAAARPRAVTTNSLGLVVPPVAQDIPKQTQEVEGLSKAFKKLAIDGNDAHSMARGLASAFNLLWLTWGNLAPLFTGAGISFGIKKTFDIGSEVEYQIKLMEALGQTVDSTGKEFVGMGSAIRAELRNIDQETQFSLVELSKAMVQLGQAGKTPQEALQMLRPAAGLASLGMTDLKTSIDLLIQTQALFNKTSADTAKIASQVFQVTKSGVLNVEDIGGSMRYASEANTRFGKSLEETLALLGALAQAGLKGASGGTALINFFRDLNGRSGPAIKAMGELERATGQQIKVFDELGHQRSAVDIFTDIANASKKLKAEEADKLLAKIFSDRGGRTFFAMIREGTIDLQKMVTELKNVDPNSIFMAAKGLMETTKGAMDILQGSLVGVFDAVFEGFSAQFKQAIVDVTAVIDSGGFKQAVAGIVGGVLGLYEAIKTVSPALITFFSLWAGYKAITIGIGIFQSLATVLAGLAPTLAMSTKGYLQQTFAVEANSIAIIGNVAALRAQAQGMDASAVAAARLSATQAVLATSSGAAGLAVRGLTAAIAFLANPIVGIVATLGMLGFAWYESSEAAKRASGDTTGTVLRDGKLNIDQWNKEIALLRTRSALLGQDSYAPKEAELKSASDNLNTLIADYDKLQARISAREQRGDTAANLNWLRQEADKKLSVIVAQETAINKAYSDINAARNEEAAAQARKEYEMERKRKEAEARLRGTIVPEKPVKAGSVREERLRLQNDNELKQIEARLKSELNLNATYYSTEKSQLEARYNANIISVAEYQSEYTRLTKEAEQKRIAIYGESSDKYGKALADRFSAMQQAFTSQIKGSQVSGELQGIIAGVNASLESGAQAYSNYYEAAAAGDYSAQETLAASLYNSKTALDAYIESLRNYVELQPEGPTKKLAAEMLNAAQAAATFQQANADAIQGSHVKMVEDSRKAYYDLAKTVGEASRSSQEFWKKERNELAEQKAVEALEKQYKFLNESVFSSDVATKAAALAREKAIGKYRQEMEKLNTAAKKAEDAVNSWATEYGAAIASGNKEAIKTLEQLIELRDKMNSDRADFVAESIASTEDLTLAAFEKARREQIEAWSSELGDAIQTAIFEGGKAGGEKFIAILRRELLTKPLQAFINATVNAVTGGLMNGLVGGAASGFASSMFGSVLGSATGNWLGAGSAMGMLGNIGAGITTGLGTLFTEGFSAWISQATGLMGAGSMGGGLGALLGPIGLLAGGLYLLSSFDKSGTPHYGAVAEYESGKVVGTEQMFYTNAGVAGRYSKGAQPGVNAVAMGAGGILDAASRLAGGKGGFKVRTAYSDDSSSDPGFGSLRIERDGRKIVDWEDTRTSRWAARVFADGEEGVKQYMNAVAKDVRTAMLDLDLPDWAKKKLNDLGDEIDLSSLSAVVIEIGKIKSVFDDMGYAIKGFADASDESKMRILEAAGGVDALAASVKTYFDNFYTEEERRAILTKKLTDEFKSQNLMLPRTREEYRALLESIDTSTEEGAKLYAYLLSKSEEFAAITTSAMDQIKLATQDIANIFLNAIQQAGSAAEASRMIQENFVDAINQSLYDSVVTSISDAVMVGVVTPMMNNLVAAATASGVALVNGGVSAGTAVAVGGITAQVAMASVLIMARAQLQALREILLDPEVQGFIKQIGAMLGDIGEEFYDIGKKSGLDDGLDKAYKALQDATNRQIEAINKQKAAIQEQRNIVAESLAMVNSVFELVKSNAAELYSKVASTSAGQVSWGRKYIADAAFAAKRTGYLPDAKELGEAIKYARSGVEGGAYTSAFERQRDILVLAGQLSEIEKISGIQKTAQEQQLDLLDSQLSELDRQTKALQEQLAYWERQVQISKGTYEATLSVAEAVRALELSILAKSSTDKVPVEEGTEVVGPTDSTYTGSGDRVVVGPTDSTYTGSGDRVVVGPTDIDTSSWGTINWGAVLLGSGWRESSSKNVSGQKELLEIPAFDVGINRVPADMVAKIHKDELIVPAQYNPYNPAASTWSTSEVDSDDGSQLEAVIVELQALRAQIAEVKYATEATAKNTGKLDDNIERYTNGGTYSRQRVMK